MTQRSVITLFPKKQKADVLVERPVKRISIRYVSREAVERLVASINRRTSDAE